MKEPKLTSAESKKLNVLERKWNKRANEIFQEKFGKRYEDWGQVIGAGVKIGKLKSNGRRWLVLKSWRGTGQTGEQEAYEEIKPILDKMGLYSQYDCGRLD